MAKMTDKQLARWEKVRKMGRAKYTLVYGVLAWGVCTGAAWAVGMSAVQGWDRLSTLLPIALVGFPIGGIGFGLLTWSLAEKQYQKALAEKSESEW